MSNASDGPTRKAGWMKRSTKTMWWAVLIVWGLSLAAFVQTQRAGQTRTSVVLLERGEQVNLRGMTAVDVKGNPRLIQPGDSAVVLLLLSPSCAACRRYLPTYGAWETYATRTDAAFRIILIGQDGNDPHFIRELPDSALVLVEQDPTLRSRLKARLVPLVVRLEVDGTVASVVTLGPDWPKG